MNFAIVLPKLALVKPIEHNERDIEGETSMGVDVLQRRAIRLPNETVEKHDFDCANYTGTQGLNARLIEE